VVSVRRSSRSNEFGKNSRFYDGLTRLSTLMPAGIHERACVERVYRAFLDRLTRRLDTSRLHEEIPAGSWVSRNFVGRVRRCVRLDTRKESRAMKRSHERLRARLNRAALRDTSSCAHCRANVWNASKLAAGSRVGGFKILRLSDDTPRECTKRAAL